MASSVYRIKQSTSTKKPIERKIVGAITLADASAASISTDGSCNYVPMQQPIRESGWTIAPPAWINENAMKELFSYKSITERDHKMLCEQEKVITYLLKELTEVKKELSEVKSKLSFSEEQELWQQSNKNVDILESIFNTGDLHIHTAEQALFELGGILKDCNKGGKNSVNLVKSVRGD